MDNPLLVAATGKLGSGKSEFSQYVAGKYQPAARLAFADPLKCESYDWIAAGNTSLPVGAPANDADMPTWVAAAHAVFTIDKPKLVLPKDAEKIAWFNERKELLRPLAQWWGTEYRRKQNPNYWIDKTTARITDILALNLYTFIIVDDCRFGNEFDALQSLGFNLIRVYCDDKQQAERVAARDGSFDPSIRNHPSEYALDHIYHPWTIDNSVPDLWQFHLSIDKVISSILSK